LMRVLTFQRRVSFSDYKIQLTKAVITLEH